MGKRRGYLFQWSNENGKRCSGTAPTRGEAKARKAAMQNRTWLAKHGVIGVNQVAYAVAAKEPLVKHLADWEATMLSKGNTLTHTKRYLRIASEVLIDGCRWSRIVELDCLAADRWISAQFRCRRWKSATCNHAVQAVRSFGRWLEQYDRSPSNAFKLLKKRRVIDEEPQGALDDAEIVRVIQAAEKGPAVYGVSGHDRGMLYRVGLGTGFRAGSLRKLTRESFVLDSAAPFVVLPASDNKSRKRKLQPIQPELGDVLKTYLANRAPREPAFRMPHPCNVVRMWRKDLAAAKVSEKNAAGEFRKFHGLRHTYITSCTRAMGLAVAQGLAGHSSPVVTARYAHPGAADRARAISSLPIAPASAALALHSEEKPSLKQSKTVQLTGSEVQTQTPDFPTISAENQALRLLGRAGIEPATHGFSVHCSTS